MKLISSIGSAFKKVTSTCDSCQRPYVFRDPVARNIGIRMNDGWYCGARCFTAAAEERMTRLTVAETEPAKRAERMPLELFLMSRGLLSKEQLKDAAGEHKESGEEIGALLVKRGMVSEKQVAAARATQWGCPLFLVPAGGVRSGVCIPPALVETYSAVPLHHGAVTGQLLVGFVLCVEYGLLSAIEQVIGCKTQASFITPGDFEIQLRMQRQAAPGGLVMFKNVQPAAAMAHALCDAALDVEANEAIIVKCRGYLWARVKRESESVDLLFRTSLPIGM